jgi:hypothetical protein
MKALIAPMQKVYDYLGNEVGVRVAQVVADDAVFDVAQPLFWTDCAAEVAPDAYVYAEGQFVPAPVPPITPVETLP